MPCLTCDDDDSQLKYLIGPVNRFTSAEYKLYTLALLCNATKHGYVSPDYVDDSNRQNEGNPQNNDTGQCVDDSEHGEDNSVITQQDKLTAYKSNISSNVAYIDDESTALMSAEYQTQYTLFVPKLKIPKVIFQQTFNQWKAEQGLSFNFRRIRKRRAIYIQPLEHFPDFVEQFEYTVNGETKRGFFQLLQHFLAIFFDGYNVQLLPTKLNEEYGWTVRSRHHKKTGEKQLLVSDIYSNMKKAVPSDGYCMLGITWTDLYPSENLNFVLGEASYAHRAAVFCFGRYEPKAYVNGRSPPPITKITGNLIWRMIKLISHETCHLFGLRHCVFFHCAMNESSSLKEALSQPVFLCPICLRKVQKCAQFDMVKRYKNMRVFFESLSEQFDCDYFQKAIKWLDKCIYFVENEEDTYGQQSNTRL